MSDWTVLMDERADGVMRSDYSLAKSTTAVPIYHEDTVVQDEEGGVSGSAEIANIDFGSYVINGQKYKDKFCLLQNSRRTNPGLCVDDLEFVVADSVIGDFGASGIIGLGPLNDARSMVHRLQATGQITYNIVGLNFEDPLDTD